MENDGREDSAIADQFRRDGFSPRDVLMAIAVVVVAGCVITVYAPYWVGLGGESLDARGNVLAAVFSGFGFIGVSVAIYLQMRELSYQREELQLTRKELARSAEAQEESARQFREASRRQSREQLLAAKLNAQVAINQVQDALHRVDAERNPAGFGIRRVPQRRDLEMREVQLQLLAKEAGLGFEHYISAEAAEKEAIRQWAIDIVHSIVTRFERRTDKDFPIDLSGAVRDLQSAIDLLRKKHPDVSRSLQSVVELLKRTPEDQNGTIAWCRAAESTAFARGQWPWA